jgi:hypothetical protein
MAAVIESTIKSDPVGRWYIEISDTMKEDSMEICLNIYEYAEKIEKMGEEYGGVVEVMWSSEENVTPQQIHEVRQQIMQYEAEEAAKKEAEGEIPPTHQQDGTPNFQ